MRSRFAFFILAVVMLIPSFASARDKDPEAMASEIHQRAISDVIYVDEELKALYYQNLAIIRLLKEIRDTGKEEADAIRQLEAAIRLEKKSE